MPPLSRFQGALLGLAAGDALGTTLEFRQPGTFTPIADMVGGGPFGLKHGQWTDDTSMALCLAESLLETDGFDPADQLTRYVRWWKEGHHSSTGRCFDIGNTVREALSAFLQHGDAQRSGATHAQSAGNGSLMRLAPVPMFYAENPQQAVVMAAASSRTTHAHREAVDACRYFAALIVGALNGSDKSTLLAPGFAPPGVNWEDEPLAPAIARIAGGSFKHTDRAAIRASGYVVHTLEAALWAFDRTDDFRRGALMAVNLGEDADTTGAVYGQLAGACYGIEGIPQSWRATVARSEEIVGLATRLFERAMRQGAAV